MFKTEALEELAKNISANLPTGIKEFKDDLHENLLGALQVAFNKLDLVTRSEFDVQTKVLAKTRAQIEELEKKLSTLESSLEA